MVSGDFAGPGVLTGDRAATYTDLGREPFAKSGTPAGVPPVAVFYDRFF